MWWKPLWQHRKGIAFLSDSLTLSPRGEQPQKSWQQPTRDKNVISWEQGSTCSEKERPPTRRPWVHSATLHDWALFPFGWECTAVFLSGYFLLEWGYMTTERENVQHQGDYKWTLYTASIQATLKCIPLVHHDIWEKWHGRKQRLSLKAFQVLQFAQNMHCSLKNHTGWQISCLSMRQAKAKHLNAEKHCKGGSCNAHRSHLAIPMCESIFHWKVNHKNCFQSTHKFCAPLPPGPTLHL